MNASVSEDTVTKIQQAILATSDIRRIIRLHAVPLGGGELLIAAKVDVSPDATMHEISAIVHIAERSVKSALPEASTVYISPDLYVDPEAETPSTSTIVTLSAN